MGEKPPTGGGLGSAAPAEERTSPVERLDFSGSVLRPGKKAAPSPRTGTKRAESMAAEGRAEKKPATTPAQGVKRSSSVPVDRLDPTA
eukprot:12908648-Prorocentrum_lima.AAC.1